MALNLAVTMQCIETARPARRPRVQCAVTGGAVTGGAEERGAQRTWRYVSTGATKPMPCGMGQRSRCGLVAGLVSYEFKLDTKWQKLFTPLDRQENYKEARKKGIQEGM